MRVDLSGQKFIFPQYCACCGTAPQTTLTTSASKSTGKKVVHTTSKSWDFPYCVQCIEHVKAANSAMVVTAVIIILALLAAGWLHFSVGASIVGLATGVLGIAGGIFAHSNLMAKAKQMCGANCACLQSAVNYHGWQGFCHTFEITSSSYALAFMVANQNKLVNVRPEVWQWLQANGHGIPPHQPQSAKRHIS